MFEASSTKGPKLIGFLYLRSHLMKETSRIWG
jgi:hypothetical protein